MKFRYLFSLIALAALPLSAQLKTDIAGSRLINDYHALLRGEKVLNPDIRLAGSPVAPHDGMSRASSVAADPGQALVGVIITMADGYSAYAADFGSLADVQTVFDDDMLSACTTVANLEPLMALPEVKLVSVGFPKKPMIWNARAHAGVNGVHSGEGIDRAYTGKGVIVGMFDTGMDPNHLAFMDGDNTDLSRVKLVLTYTGDPGRITGTYDTPEKIANFTTENTNNNHGTHVMGIAAGAYKGPGTYHNGNSLQSDVSSMPLSGVAPQADIVMAGGTLYNNSIANGVEKLIDYAESQGKPAVINLSLGSLLGAHDGTDSDCQTLARLGKRAIICVAAGNDGDVKCAFKASAGLKAVTRTIGIAPYVSGDVPEALVWSDSDKPFSKFEFVLFDATGTQVYAATIGNTNGVNKYFVPSASSSSGTNYTKVSAMDEGFDASSYFQIRTFVNSTNQKYVAQIAHRLKPTATESLRAAIRVKLTSSQTVYGLISDGTFTNHGLNASGWVDGTSDGSISAMATGENILVVGAYNTTPSFGRISGGIWTPEDNVGDVASFSSYGTAYDPSGDILLNRSLPDVSAPGVCIISAQNSYYNNGNGLYSTATAAADKGGKSYYWHQMSGTSMATPFTTGTVALWLEADPNLTIDDVKAVVKNSSAAQGSTSDEKARWGAGQLQALKGIEEVIQKRSAIGSVFEDPDKRFILQQADGQLDIFVAGADRVAAALYNISGQQVDSASANADRLTVDTSRLVRGIYVLRVDTPQGRFTRKVML